MKSIDSIGTCEYGTNEEIMNTQRKTMINCGDVTKRKHKIP